MTVTPATLWLDEKDVEYDTASYDYRRSGAEEAAYQIDVDPHCMIKTLVMEDEHQEPFIVLMHGDFDVSTKEMARERGVKSVKTCSRRNAQRYTGYLVGGISPFATKHALPVYTEETIMDLPYIYINGGRRGLLLKIKPLKLLDLLKPTIVSVSHKNINQIEKQ